MSQSGLVDIENSHPQIPTKFVTDVGDAVPISNTLEILGGVGIDTSASGNTVTINSSATAALPPITKYVVDSTGDTDYTTIQSAIDAANTAGINALVYIRPGSYTESLTFYDGVDLEGSDSHQVFITGIHVPPATGTIALSDLSLISATHAFSSAVAGTADIILNNILTNCTNGYTFNLPNWGSGDITANNVKCSGTNDGFLNNTGDISLLCDECDLGNGTGNTTIIAGEIVSRDCEFGSPMTISGASTSKFTNTNFINNVDFTVDCAAEIVGGVFDTSANIPISFNTTADLTLSNVTINTSNTQAIDGAGTGTINMGQIDFIDGSSIDTATTVSVLKTTTTSLRAWNGSFIESPAVTVTATGGVITCSVEKNGGGDLTLINQNGFYFWDTTPAATVSLTAGTDVAPTINYVYLDGITKVLTASTVSFPLTGYAPLATVLCQSAASLETEGAYKVHSWTDHLTSTLAIGHIGHINSWIRHQNATWESGVVQNYTITPGAPDNVTIQTTAGVVLQLHDHTFPAFSTPIDYYVVNDSVAAYTVVTDLNALLTDSAGVSMSGRYFSLVLWGCISEETGDCKMYINLPSGSYNSSSLLTADSSKYANFTIPAEFTGTGFLISQWNLRHSAAGGGTWTSINEVDLRGFYPGVSAGAGSAAATEFPDNTFRIFDDSDATKEIAFQASGITTATTRTMTVQDADGIIAYTNVANYGTGATSFTDHGVLLGSGTAAITATAEPSNGQLLIGNTGNDPSLATLASADGTIAITNGAGTIDLAVSGGGMIWEEVTAATKTMVVNTAYGSNLAGGVTYTLPATSTAGDVIEIVGMAGTYIIAQNAGNTIYIGDTNSTAGVTGTLTSNDAGDCITLRCISTSANWRATSWSGDGFTVA